MPRGWGIVWNSACAYLRAIFPSWLGELEARCFWNRTQNSGERQSNDSKEQQPQRTSLLGIGDGASVAIALIEIESLQSFALHPTGNSYTAIAIWLHQAWHNGYYEGSTTRGW